MEPAANPYQSPRQQPVQNGALRPDEALIRFHQTLPRVCALCGAPAVTSRKIAFKTVMRAILGWSHWSSDEAAVFLPLCRRHRFFRWGWPLTAQIALSLPVFLIVLCAGIMSAAAQSMAAMYFIATVGVLWGAIVVPWIVFRAMRPYASRVTARDFVLTGVAPEFARACAEAYERKAEATNEAIDSLFE